MRRLADRIVPPLIVFLILFLMVAVSYGIDILKTR